MAVQAPQSKSAMALERRRTLWPANDDDQPFLPRATPDAAPSLLQRSRRVPEPPPFLRPALAPHPLKIRKGDPWQMYKRLVKTRLGGEVVVACRKSRPENFVTVRTLETSHLEVQLNMLDHVRHDAFLNALEIYHNGGQYLVVSPFLHVSLSMITAAPVQAEEPQIAHIVFQASVAASTAMRC